MPSPVQLSADSGLNTANSPATQTRTDALPEARQGLRGQRESSSVLDKALDAAIKVVQEDPSGMADNAALVTTSSSTWTAVKQLPGHAGRLLQDSSELGENGDSSLYDILPPIAFSVACVALVAMLLVLGLNGYLNSLSCGKCNTANDDTASRGEGSRDTTARSRQRAEAKE